jgi:signal transduction histidine kinase
MNNAMPSPTSGAAAPALTWRRVRATVLIATPFGLLNAVTSLSSLPVVFGRTVFVALAAMLAFSLVERWPAPLPSWLARWVLQLLGVVVAVPLAAFLAYWATNGFSFQFLHDGAKRNGVFFLIVMGILFAPWIALAAMLRQREAFARGQALAFALERSELERQALDARMRLLQSQVQPHFLFNTLANIQALVDAGSPHASQVLRTLTAYLRAAVPRLNDPVNTLEQELQLVRAYLDLMHMRMPDRLQFSIAADPAALALRCPPLTLLTLVENAVRHGIDPGEEGGSIDIVARVWNGRCQLRVSDTGVGLQQTGSGDGTGLANLRERLQLAFGGDVQVRLSGVTPHGVCAELEFPALGIAA